MKNIFRTTSIIIDIIGIICLVQFGINIWIAILIINIVSLFSYFDGINRKPKC